MTVIMEILDYMNTHEEEMYEVLREADYKSYLNPDKAYYVVFEKRNGDLYLLTIEDEAEKSLCGVMPNPKVPAYCIAVFCHSNVDALEDSWSCLEDAENDIIEYFGKCGFLAEYAAKHTEIKSHVEVVESFLIDNGISQRKRMKFFRLSEENACDTLAYIDSDNLFYDILNTLPFPLS